MSAEKSRCACFPSVECRVVALKLDSWEQSVVICVWSLYFDCSFSLMVHSPCTHLTLFKNSIKRYINMSCLGLFYNMGIRWKRGAIIRKWIFFSHGRLSFRQIPNLSRVHPNIRHKLSFRRAMRFTFGDEWIGSNQNLITSEMKYALQLSKHGNRDLFPLAAKRARANGVVEFGYFLGGTNPNLSTEEMPFNVR